MKLTFFYKFLSLLVLFGRIKKNPFFRPNGQKKREQKTQSLRFALLVLAARGPMSLLQRNVPVVDVDPVAQLLQLGGDVFRNGYAAVRPAGTADGDDRRCLPSLI